MLSNFFRMAYGMAGSQVGSDLSELVGLAQRYFEKSKVTVDWPSRSVPDGISGGVGKLLLNMVALAAEGLPRGGRITVHLEDSAGSIVARVQAEGEGCALREDTATGLDPAVRPEELTPRNVQGYFTRVLARRLESGLEVDRSISGQIRFSVVF